MKKSNEEIYNVAAINGAFWLRRLSVTKPIDKAIIEIEMSACICAELDRNHNRIMTQRLQKFVWGYNYLKHNCSKEEYEKSGYFDEKFLEKLLTII